MIIQKIDSSQIKDILLIGKNFTDEKGIDGFNPEVFVNNWSVILGNKTGVVYVAIEDGDVIGTIGAVIHNDINTGKKTASELFWFVDKEHRGTAGKALFNTFIEWAIELDCKLIMMAHFLDKESKGLDMFYIKNGFRPIETQYIKEV